MSHEPIAYPWEWLESITSVGCPMCGLPSPPSALRGAGISPAAVAERGTTRQAEAFLLVITKSAELGSDHRRLQQSSDAELRWD
jgi:hypothetical protein